MEGIATKLVYEDNCEEDNNEDNCEEGNMESSPSSEDSVDAEEDSVFRSEYRKRCIKQIDRVINSSQIPRRFIKSMTKNIEREVSNVLDEFKLEHGRLKTDSSKRKREEPQMVFPSEVNTGRKDQKRMKGNLM